MSIVYEIVNATPDDCQDIYNWRTYHLNTNYSDTNNFDYESHKQWFAEYVKKERMYIIKYNTIPVCVVRMDGEKEYLVSIYCRPGFHYQGHGKIALLMAHKHTINKFGKKPFIAKIQPYNLPSLKVFESCGYKFNEGIYIKSTP